MYERIQNLIEGSLSPLWVERMGLGHWELEHAFLNSQFLEEAMTDDFLITATTEARWNYLQAKIKWYLPSAVRHSDARLEKTLVHELCHVVLAPEQSLLEIKLQQIQADYNGDDAEKVQTMMFERMELATEQMARSILKAWRSPAAD